MLFTQKYLFYSEICFQIYKEIVGTGLSYPHYFRNFSKNINLI